MAAGDDAESRSGLVVGGGTRVLFRLFMMGGLVLREAFEGLEAVPLTSTSCYD